MEKENGSHEFTMKQINETKSYLLEEIKHSDFMIKKHETKCKTTKHAEYIFI